MQNFNASISRRSLLKGTVAGLGFVALGGLAGCGGTGTGSGSASSASTKLTVAASPTPHAEILNDFAADKLKEQDIELTVKEYEQYIVKVMVPVESKVINP